MGGQADLAAECRLHPLPAGCDEAVARLHDPALCTTKYCVSNGVHAHAGETGALGLYGVLRRGASVPWVCGASGREQGRLVGRLSEQQLAVGVSLRLCSSRIAVVDETEKNPEGCVGLWLHTKVPQPLAQSASAA